jgi:hypothetical protein
MKLTVTGAILVGLALVSVAASTAGRADPVGPQGVQSLHEKVASIVDHPTPEEPFYVRAEVKHHMESSEAALYFPHTVEEIADLLQETRTWCEILPLHINIKACTYSPDGDQITMYMGRKFYQDPDDAYMITYSFSTTVEDGYFNAVAVADEGPLGTSDYHIDFEVVAAGDRSFARIHVSDHQSWTSSNAMRVYLHTKGKTKEGVSVVGHDDAGNPIYSTGMPAIAERNLLRYYFAFAAFFESTDITDKVGRHEKQLEFWFDQTEKYPQLHELDKATYLEEKRHERQNQIALQQELL